MNMRSVLFCGLITCILGSVLGLALAEINRGDRNPNSHLHYAIVGAAIGLFIGSAQEGIRQKAREVLDEEETLTSYKH
ncbi:MAG: hypothetical protein QNJ46_15125 [Leptolyngbyaceae cyanobacterium MO_188.B28]|nr:hypothetical protein [Leptolyngbyaceae cyanobacterium MO_188.B28]